MGIYDRDYYRREGPSFLSTFNSRAPVCKWLIVVNLVFFIIQLSTLERNRVTNHIVGEGPFTAALDLRPDKVVEDGQVWRLLTHAFLHSHAKLLHILFNLLLLWWMGNELEELYGSREFLALYLISAIFAGVCMTIHGLTMPGHIAALGASGAVSALTVLFACHWPHRTVLLFFVIPMPIWLLAVIFFGWDFVLFLMSRLAGVQTETGVAAHLGGALFGWLYHRQHWKLTALGEWFGEWRRRRSRPNLKIYREEEPAVVAAPTRAPAEHEIDEHFEAKLDAVLEKMSLVGKDNLTEAEKEILLKASEIYKRRQK